MRHLDTLPVFVKVVEERGFTGAAKALGIEST